MPEITVSNIAYHMWHTSSAVSALDITLSGNSFLCISNNAGGLSFDSTIARATNLLLPGIPHATQEMLTQLCVGPWGLHAALGRYITTVPTFPVAKISSSL